MPFTSDTMILTLPAALAVNLETKPVFWLKTPAPEFITDESTDQFNYAKDTNLPYISLGIALSTIESPSNISVYPEGLISIVLTSAAILM